MEKILFEVCCGSAEDAIASYKGGAARVELNSDLFHGGLTPTLGTLLTVRKHCPDLKIICMVRPREGGFCYTETEFETMKEDARILTENGADGIAFGILREDGTIDRERCAEMVRVIGKKESVFHRAIDVVPDWKEAMDVLMELHVTRILTSGQKPTVPEGAFTIKEMIDYADGRIEILPGAGIRSANVEWVKNITGTKMVHASMHRVQYDRSTLGNTSIHYGGAVYPPEDRYSVTCPDDVAAFIQAAEK